MAAQATPCVVEPTVEEYDPARKDVFVRRLKTLEESTLFSPLQRLEQALLEVRTTSRGEERLYCQGRWLSRHALLQMCKLLSPGLTVLTCSLAGIVRRSVDADAYCSRRQAVQLFNSVLRLRFEIPGGLRGKQLVINSAEGTIDGVVGAGYRYLPNHKLYAEVERTVRQEGANFVHGWLCGRQMTCSFYDGRTFQTDWGGHVDDWATGFYFSNTEVGDRSVRTARLLVRTKWGHRCLSQPHRVKHSGRLFERKLIVSLGKMLVDSREESKLRDAIRSRMGATLGMVAAADLRAKRISQLSSSLERFAGSRDTAERIVRWAAFAGAYASRKPERLALAELESRTEFDLFASMLRVAKGLALTPRERLETHAFDYLMAEKPPA